MGKYDSFFTNSNDLFSIISLDGRFIELSPSWETHLGWTIEELKAKSILDFIHPEDRDRVMAEAQENNEQAPRRLIDSRFIHKDNTYRWLSWSYTKSPDGQQVYAVARDITSLRKNNLSLEALMASLDDLVILIDESGLFIDLWTSNNDLLFLPKEKIVGNTIRDVFGYAGVSFESVMKQSFRLNRSLSIEFQFPGVNKWLSAKVTPIDKTSGHKRLASFLIRDISDKIEADHVLDQERGRLLASSKMATLGEMAAGIAHEINNPLAIIQGKAWLLKKQVEENKIDNKVFAENLKAISDTTERISKIIQGLKTFARNAENDPFTETTASQIIDETLELCRERFKNSGIQLRIVGKRPYPLECRGVQISQVVLNVLSNAYDAVYGTPDPWVELAVHDYPDKIEFVITDSGNGIPSHLQEKILQPFFTTKEVGKGTGLGLSITKGIVESHKGEFFYDKTSPNTRFVIRLPKRQNYGPKDVPA